MISNTEFLIFLNKIPSDQNPYVATADLFQKAAAVPKNPTWSINVQGVLLISHVVLWLQALILFLMRLRIEPAFRLRVNKLGLVVLNVSEVCAIAYWIHATLAVIHLAILQAENNGFNARPVELLLHGYRFLPVTTGAWGFLWACACQCVTILWNRINLKSSKDRHALSLVICYGMYFWGVGGILATYFGVLWGYGKAQAQYNKISSILDGVQRELSSASRNYDPKTYSKMEIVKLVMPVQEVTKILPKLERNVKIGLSFYLFAIIFLTVAYIPVFSIGYKSIQRLLSLTTTADNSDEDGEETSIKKKVEKHQSLLNFHAFVLYFGTDVYLPVIVWQLWNAREGFLSSVNWLNVTVLATSGPPCIIGNFALVVLIYQAWNVLAEKRMNNYALTDLSTSLGDQPPTVSDSNNIERTSVWNLSQSVSYNPGSAQVLQVEKQKLAHFKPTESRKGWNQVVRTPGFQTESESQSQSDWEERKLKIFYK